MKILLVNSFLAVITLIASLDGGSNMKISHNGQIIEAMDSVKEAHFNHGDEPAVLYNGRWIPQSTFEAFQEQIALTQSATSAAARGGHYTPCLPNEWEDEE